MRPRNIFTGRWGWAGVLAGVFAMMSACDDGGGGGGGGAGTCGNGVIDPQEVCDKAIEAGNPGACPRTCNDGVSCTTDTLENAGTCNAMCKPEIINACQPGDGCCPAMCTSDSDSDCSSTCANGVVEANEKCDLAIAPGSPGSCRWDCDDGLACTVGILLNGGTCAAECAFVEISGCVDGDGCCPSGCVADSDCVVLSRIKQSVITEVGTEDWFRNGYWDGVGYKNWTAWTGQGLTGLVTGQGNAQAYRGIDHVVLGDGKVQQSVLQMDGTRVWSHDGTWDGTAYSNWSAWVDLLGDLTLLVPGVQAYRSFDQVVLPDGRRKQTVVTWDGRTAYYRYADWDANTKTYVNWTAWTNQFGDLTTFIAGQGSFRSMNHVVRANNTIKQALLSEDGKTLWHRDGTWDGTKYATWTNWTNQWGDMTKLVPGKGETQASLSWDEASLAGMGVSTGCQNGCDDGDACTDDSCVGGGCQHAPKSCNDGDLCTSDACVNGVCQNIAKNCDDGQGCTVDWCVNDICHHSDLNNCDDGNPCTDDICANNACMYNNNTASCGNGGTCQNGSCQPGGGSGSSSSGGPGPCTCTSGCKDSCGQPCNEGATCGQAAACNDGNCICNGGPWCPALGLCCPIGATCSAPPSAPHCCSDPILIWLNLCNGPEPRCGVFSDPGCPDVDCGACAGANEVCVNGLCKGG